MNYNFEEDTNVATAYDQWINSVKNWRNNIVALANSVRTAVPVEKVSSFAKDGVSQLDESEQKLIESNCLQYLSAVYDKGFTSPEVLAEVIYKTAARIYNREQQYAYFVDVERGLHQLGTYIAKLTSEAKDDFIEYLAPIRNVILLDYYDWAIIYNVDEKDNLRLGNEIDMLLNHFKAVETTIIDEMRRIRYPKFDNPLDVQVNDVKTSDKKISWHGTPAQFAFVMTLLKSKGYISFPEKGATAAGIFLQIFDLPNSDSQNLKSDIGRYLKEGNDKNVVIINREDAESFTVPKRVDLKR